MRVAFYAPLKPIDHPVPSGDRRLGRLLVDALALGGHEVEIACRLRTRLATADPDRQARFARLGQRMADRLVERYRRRDPGRRPEAWLTYHLYYKAPDWLGPRVAHQLRIPYLAAEASLAPKRANGPWRIGHEAVIAALAAADVVFALSRLDAECLAPALGPRTRLEHLPPFLEPADYEEAASMRSEHRARIAGTHGIDSAPPWLIAVAMMREGDKLRSYEILGRALERIMDRPWRLLVVGDGPARPAVEHALAPLRSRATFVGALDGDRLPAYYAAGDLLVWPAVNEAFGMALLEAQAAGTPVVAGAAGGVPDVVAHDASGLLAPPGDVDAFAAAIASLIDAPALLRRLAAGTQAQIRAEHAIGRAAEILDRTLALSRRQPRV